MVTFTGEIFNEKLHIFLQWLKKKKLKKSFAYLGKNFNFSMTCGEIKKKRKSEKLVYILTINKLPLKSRYKIEIFQRYVISKLKGRFSIYNIPDTWVNENKGSADYHKW